MKPRFLLLVLLAFAPTYLTAQQQNPDPDSKQDDLAVCARLKLMNQSEFQVLMAKAQSGDAAAQYQVGKAYDVGKHAAVDAKEHLSAAQVQEADRLIKSFCLDAAWS